MEWIRFRCECGRGLKARPELAGRRCRCPDCAREPIIPPAPAPAPGPVNIVFNGHVYTLGAGGANADAIRRAIEGGRFSGFRGHAPGESARRLAEFRAKYGLPKRDEA